jgi:hypothetical protein
LQLRAERAPQVAAHARYPEFLDGAVQIEFYGAVTAATKARFENNWAQQPIEWHAPVVGFMAALPPRTRDARVDGGPPAQQAVAFTAPVVAVALPHATPLRAAELGSVIPECYGRSPVLPLYQWWMHPWQLPAEHAKARVGFTPAHLCFYLYMVDSDVISYSTADGQKMWQLGDCIEVFIKPEDGRRTDYWEIHVTPNDHMMAIHIPYRGYDLMGTTAHSIPISVSCTLRPIPLCG